MKVLDRNLTPWQAGILVFILLFANKILVLPSLLYEGAKVEGIFVILALFAAEFGLLWLFRSLKIRFPNQSFSQVLSGIFGKTRASAKFAKIATYALFCVFFLCKAVLLYNVTYIFFRNVIYKDYNNFLFLFCFLPIINHMAFCGLRAMGRTAQLFFPLIALICVFCIVVGIFGCDSMPLLFQSSLGQIVQTGLKHVSAFGDIIFMFVIFDKIRVSRGQFKPIFGLAAAAMALVTAVTLVFFFSYTDTAFMHPYAMFDILSYVKEYGGLGRIDIISMIVIIIFSYFQLGIYLKAFMLAFAEIFPKISSVYGALSFNFCFLAMLFFIQNLEQAVVFGEEILPFLEIFPFILLPIEAVAALCKKPRALERKSVIKKENSALILSEFGEICENDLSKKSELCRFNLAQEAEPERGTGGRDDSKT